MNPTGYIWNIAGMNRAGVPRRLRLRPSEFAELCRLPGFGGGGAGAAGDSVTGLHLSFALESAWAAPSVFAPFVIYGGEGGGGEKAKTRMSVLAENILTLLKART